MNETLFNKCFIFLLCKIAMAFQKGGKKIEKTLKVEEIVTKTKELEKMIINHSELQPLKLGGEMKPIYEITRKFQLDLVRKILNQLYL